MAKNTDKPRVHRRRQGIERDRAASNLLLTSAQALPDEGSRLEREVEKFLHSVRAA
jgi:hypothetical protein